MARVTRPPRASSGRRRSGRRRRWPWLVVALLVALGLLWLLLPFWRLTDRFGDGSPSVPSRLYARAEVVGVDDPWSARRVASYLERLAYRRTEAKRDLLPGEYRIEGSELTVYQRSFPTPRGKISAHRLTVGFVGERIRSLTVEERELERAWLEPPLLTSYYGSDLRERRPVELTQLPRDVTTAILAAEDAGFFQHPGVSLGGILRAAWANLRGGGVQQGGSTLTQQLVKNLYLTQERTFERKLREAILAAFLELRYSKEQILEAYLNEVYWGRSGRVHLVGVGAASFAFFGKTPAELTLAEAATLAGVIPAPNRLSPLRHPEEARTARDRVLLRMVELGWLDAAVAHELRGQELVTAPQPIELDFARYAAEAAAAEAAERWQLGDLAGQGYSLISTLSLADQEAAERTLEQGLAELEKQWQRGKEQPLQGMLLSVDPRDGSILAYVGGRDWQGSQFDRLRFARRQAGSAFKPIVYAAALAERTVSPIDLLEDSPIEVVQAGQSWRPRNDDGEFRGAVTVREAITRSLNVPTVELALRVGLDAVVRRARDLGIESRLDPLPSLALGAFEVTPRELLTAYATFANGGRRPQLHLVEAVLDRAGEPLGGHEVAPPEPVIEPGVAYLVTSLLEGVVDGGTARRARWMGLADPVAGKTGTTNDGRDSWFLGYTLDRATLVWVGYDENDATRLSGSRGALPIWTEFMLDRRPAVGYSMFLPPADVVSATVDPASGQLATGRCPESVTEFFLADRVPEEECVLHGGRPEQRRGLWKRLFGRKTGSDDAE